MLTCSTFSRIAFIALFMISAASQALAQYAVQFDGTNDYVTFGQATSTLGAQSFTLECWFKRTAPGVATSTGTSGVNAVPLVTKGRAEADGTTADMNYFLAINVGGAGFYGPANVLVADFEEGTGATSPGLNHPVSGVTTIVNNIWYHAAVTYNVATRRWQLFLNGNLEKDTVIAAGTRHPQNYSTQHVGLGTAFTSVPAAAGFFAGIMDEPRIWNVARTQAQIQTTMSAELTSGTGLLGRWGLNEGFGTRIYGSAGTTVVDGTTTNGGSNWSWLIPGAPFNLVVNQAADQPTLVSPASGATGVAPPVNLTVNVTDPESQNMTVRFYGRQLAATAAPDFTIVGIPDTQYYTSQLNGGTNVMLKAQMNWIKDNVATKNIVYVATLGDCVEHGDNGGNDIEWKRADTSYSIIENPTTTGLPDGVPYGITVGNHDQSPSGDPTGTTTFYNQHFGTTRFTGRSYYGGHYGANNDNWYDLFSTGGMDFITISFEYDTTPDVPILDWADNLLTTYSNRRAIILSHWIVNTGNPGSYSAQGQGIYDRLKTHSNLFLMLCGHVAGEGRRSDSFSGNTVYSLLADYQGRTNGGNGWLRILEFSPANNIIHVKTYSPTLGTFETDSDSQFDLSYNMNAPAVFQLIATNSGVGSGSNTSALWSGLAPNTQYEWYTTVSDGSSTITSPTWTFTTGTPNVVWVNPAYIPSSSEGYAFGYDAFTGVSAAVAAVNAGGTVNVAAATYNESVNITKDITLTGSGNPTIQNVTINTNQVTLGGNLQISGTLAFSNGRLPLGANNLTIGSAGTITGVTTTKYIVTNSTGYLIRQGIANGAAVAFPVGNLAYNPVTLRQWSNTTARTYSVLARHGLVPASNDDSSAIRRTWVITQLPVADTVHVQFTLQWNTSGQASVFTAATSGSRDTSQCKPYWNNPGGWLKLSSTYGKITSITPAGDPAIATVVTRLPFGGSPWTIALSSGALPIQLSSFTATLQNNNVRLNWSTISEVNNYGFYVEKKRLAETEWNEVENSFIPGHGTTNLPQHYSFIDNSIASGVWQYRLRQVDLDGAVHYTEPVQVDALTDVKKVAPMQFALSQNYPNPFNPSTEIKFSVEATDHAKLDVYNSLGQKVATLFDDVVEPGYYYTAKFDASKLASGLYIYRLRSGIFIATRKLLLMK